MSVVARRFASSPERTAMETWNAIIDRLAPDPNSPARSELRAAAGVACASISSEATADDAIVVWGSGPRVRIYCVFGDDAITGDDVNEDPLVECPTEGDWSLSIPCPEEDVEWSNRSLRAATTRVRARAVGDPVDDKEDADATAPRPLAINRQEFFRS